MNANRIWALGTILVIGVVLALGYLLGISPKMTELSAGEAALQGVKAQNAQHLAELLVLQKQYEQIDELKAQLEELQTAIPADLDLPDFIRQLNELAATTQVRIDSINTGQPETFVPAEIPGTMLNDAGEAVPLPSPPGNLITVNFVIKITGSAEGIKNFTNGLQNGERLFFVKGLVINSSTTKATETEAARTTFDGEVTGFAFILTSPAS